METEKAAELVRLCRTDEVYEGVPHPVNPDGFPRLAVCRVREAFYAIDNLCTHGNGVLTDGTQEDDTIECPVHGGVFNIRTGAALVFPCRIPLGTHPVSIVDGWICVPRPAP